AAGHLPASDRLHGGAIARIHGKVLRAYPAHVAHAAVHQRAQAASFLHADGDQFAEIADAVAITAPDADVALRQALTGLHLLGVAAQLVRRHLAPDRVGPAGEASGG